MEKFAILKQKVTDLYEAKDPGRTPWAEWLWQQHLPYVVDRAQELAKEKGANVELSMAGALLHDIADVKMKRWEDGHEEEGLRMARDLMKQSGFSTDEIAVVVDDGIRLHGCYDGNRPKSLEGQVLATADALAHINTDFYVYATWALSGQKTLKECKEYALTKMPRDFNHKICFDDVREQARPNYEALQNVFSR
jgi:putative nucleotidyltransferase with HDIG domain